MGIHWLDTFDLAAFLPLTVSGVLRVVCLFIRACALGIDKLVTGDGQGMVACAPAVWWLGPMYRSTLHFLLLGWKISIAFKCDKKYQLWEVENPACFILLLQKRMAIWMARLPSWVFTIYFSLGLMGVWEGSKESNWSRKGYGTLPGHQEKGGNRGNIFTYIHMQ